MIWHGYAMLRKRSRRFANRRGLMWPDNSIGSTTECVGQVPPPGPAPFLYDRLVVSSVSAGSRESPKRLWHSYAVLWSRPRPAKARAAPALRAGCVGWVVLSPPNDLWHSVAVLRRARQSLAIGKQRV